VGLDDYISNGLLDLEPLKSKTKFLPSDHT